MTQTPGAVASYPVEYTYDPQGRIKTMKTWQDFSGDSGTAATTWTYDAYTGHLKLKRYVDGFTVAGRILGVRPRAFSCSAAPPKAMKNCRWTQARPPKRPQ